MENNRKKLLIPALIALCLLIGYLWSNFFRLPFIAIPTIEAVPATASLFMVFPQHDVLSVQSEKADTFKQWLSLMPEVERDFDKFRKVLDSLSIEWRPGSPLTMVLLPTGNGNVALTIIADLKDRGATLPSLFEKLAEKPIEEVSFRDMPIYSGHFFNDGEVSFTHYQNLLIMGRVPLCVEECLDGLLTSTGIGSRQKFASVDFKGEKDRFLSIYLSSEFLPELLLGRIDNKVLDKARALRGRFDWLRLDIHKEGEEVHLNGQLDPANGSFIEALSNRQNEPWDSILNLLPSDPSFIQRWNVGDIQQVYKKTDNNMLTRLERFLLPWADGDIIYLQTEPYQANNSSWAVFIKCKDQARAEESLEALAEEMGLLESFNYQIFAIKQLLVENLFSPLINQRCLNPYYTFLEDFVVFSGSRAGMELIIDRYIVGNTLSSDADFLQFLENNKEPYQMSWIFNTTYLEPLIAPHLTGMNSSAVRAILQQLEAYQFIGLGLKREGRQLELKGKLTKVEQEENEPVQVLWRAYLETEIIAGPFIWEGKQPLIIVQDADWQIHGIDRQGRRLWKKQLDAPILSDIYPVGYYGVEKKELLFNTSKSVYLVNREGEDQGVFPISLSVRATNGLLPVDFEEDGNYVFFLAAQNGRVYGYDKKGQPLPGWSAHPGIGRVYQPIRYFWANQKDHLVFLNESGVLNVLSRRGAERFPPIPLDSISLSPPFFQNDQAGQRIAVCGENGIAHAINFQGNSFRLNLPVGRNQNVQFTFADIVGDERKDYIVSSDRSVAAYHYQNNGFVKRFSTQLDIPVDTIFEVKKGGDKSMIGVLSSTKKRIVVLDNQGKVRKGFPLAGTTSFQYIDLYGNGSEILIVGNGSSVVAYSF